MSAAQTQANRSGKAKAGGGDRRDLILKAAARRFAEFGFGATTVRQIADDVSILSGSLYHHFATKEEMLDEILRSPIEEKCARTLRIAALPLGPEERLVAMIEDEIDALTTDREAHAIVFNERKFIRRSEFFRDLLQTRKNAFDAWQAVIEEGMKSGVFREDTASLYLTVSTIQRMINSAADWYVHEDGSPIDTMVNYTLEELTEYYIGFILRALRTPERAGEPIPRSEVAI